MFPHHRDFREEYIHTYWYAYVYTHTHTPTSTYVPPTEPRNKKKERENKASKSCFNPDLMTEFSHVKQGAHTEIHRNTHTPNTS